MQDAICPVICRRLPVKAPLVINMQMQKNVATHLDNCYNALHEV